MKTVCASLLFTLFGFCLYAQIKKIEPPNWWVGMKNQELQLLVYGDSIFKLSPEIQYAGVSLKNWVAGSSPNYLFLNISISESAKPGTVQIDFKGERNLSIKYELLGRTKHPNDYIGFDSSDAIYLITPDRFANGNPKNDSVQEMLETDVDRNHDYKRHGGDIQGIIDHLNYISKMGFTAIWSSPLLENDMPEQSYHGYAITDFYQVDPRFGTLDKYKVLAQKAAKKGIKLIMDQVANHCGREHWWMEDLPFKDWVNHQQEFENGASITVTNHRRTVNQDIYASEYDKAFMEKGWFVPSMPDLNQENSFLAKYLIQNSIWWIETLGLGGIRQDTYPYPNKNFMAKWAKAIMNEYPNFNIVGEEWSYNPLLVGYWQDGSKNNDGYKSYLKSTMDFPMQKALVDALNEPESWNKGLIKLYEGLANDFGYSEPQSILFFADNHDMDRIFTQLNEDLALVKMAMAFILVAPRTPQIYYGTEVLMENSEKPGDHGLIRTDFPGGWSGDETNAFSGIELSEEQRDMQSFLKSLLHFRKNSKALQQGRTIHFAPENGTYVLFRQHKNEKVFFCINKNPKEVELDLRRFSELQIANQEFVNILNSREVTLKRKLIVGPKQVLILSSKKE